MDDILLHTTSISLLTCNLAQPKHGSVRDQSIRRHNMRMGEHLPTTYLSRPATKHPQQCYIGHKTLYQAIALFQKTYPGGSSDEFKVIYLPFYRDRTLSKKGIPLEGRLRESMSEEEVDKLKAYVQRVGSSHSINFTFDTIIGHTRDSQRLIHFAGLKGEFDSQKALVEEMYSRWHEVGGDITSHEFLLECATAAGLVEVKVREFLESGKYAAEVDEMDAAARAEGVCCVPTFVVNGRKIEGAEDVETFYEILVEVKEGE